MQDKTKKGWKLIIISKTAAPLLKPEEECVYVFNSRAQNAKNVRKLVVLANIVYLQIPNAQTFVKH